MGVIRQFHGITEGPWLSKPDSLKTRCILQTWPPELDVRTSDLESPCKLFNMNTVPGRKTNFEEKGRMPWPIENS